MVIISKYREERNEAGDFTYIRKKKASAQFVVHVFM